MASNASLQPMDTYSIKETIEEFREDVNRRFDKVDAAQAHTNGDVSSLKIWRGYTTGALAVVVILVIPLVVYVWNQNTRTNARIDTLAPATYENR